MGSSFQGDFHTRTLAGFLAFAKVALLESDLICGFDYHQTSRRTAESHVNTGSAVDCGGSTEIGKGRP